MNNISKNAELQQSCITAVISRFCFEKANKYNKDINDIFLQTYETKSTKSMYLDVLFIKNDEYIELESNPIPKLESDKLEGINLLIKFADWIKNNVEKKQHQTGVYWYYKNQFLDSRVLFREFLENGL